MKGQWWIALGILLLVHSTYATIRYRQYITLLEEEFIGLPFDIILECITGSVLCCWGCVLYGGGGGKYKPLKITAHLAERTWDSYNHRRSFATFSHRGQTFLNNVIATKM
eukprot:TRINITY_DN6643_c0_g1_i1.p1 TRINITY_DN6643_c0_g1~~TRINITY_DN6643_c0_g1_i1.p1  ORF type:complete len:119 (-),score=7.11 TRINITY_DN6643_c0_g1_i1:67-396(-)